MLSRRRLWRGLAAFGFMVGAAFRLWCGFWVSVADMFRLQRRFWFSGADTFRLWSKAAAWRGRRRLQLINSGPTRRCTRPPTASAFRSFLAPSLRFRRRVSLVVVLLARGVIECGILSIVKNGKIVALALGVVYLVAAYPVMNWFGQWPAPIWLSFFLSGIFVALYFGVSTRRRASIALLSPLAAFAQWYQDGAPRHLPKVILLL